MRAAVQSRSVAWISFNFGKRAMLFYPAPMQDVERHRFDHAQTMKPVRMLQSHTQRDRAAVGMADQMDGSMQPRDNRVHHSHFVGQSQRPASGPRIGFVVAVQIGCNDMELVGSDRPPPYRGSGQNLRLVGDLVHRGRMSPFGSTTAHKHPLILRPHLEVKERYPKVGDGMRRGRRIRAFSVHEFDASNDLGELI